jgi:peptidoglycan-N-acetylglucosamine deacetylase
MTLLLFILGLFFLYWVGLLYIKTIFVVFYILYWLPKIVVIKLVEIIFPTVIMRNLQSKHIALTFDDVPYGSHEQIIKILDKNLMKATFFIISSDVNETNIGSLIEAVRNGHQLANHGKTNSMHFLKDATNLHNEIVHCDKLIRNIYQQAEVPLPKKMVYRPGCGLFGPQMLSMVENYNYVLALGSVYPADPIICLPIINYYYLIGHIEAGDIIILHDRLWTPSTLDKLVKWLHRNNLDSITVDSMLSA